jgi:dUTPase
VSERGRRITANPLQDARCLTRRSTRLQVILINHGPEPFTVERGTPIALLVVVPALTLDVPALTLEDA